MKMRSEILYQIQQAAQSNVVERQVIIYEEKFEELATAINRLLNEELERQLYDDLAERTKAGTSTISRFEAKILFGT